MGDNILETKSSLLDKIQQLESELKKRDELLGRAEQIIRDLDDRYFEDNLDFLDEINELLRKPETKVILKEK